MALGRSSVLLPEDFKIGPLGDAGTAKKDQQSAMLAARAFLSALMAGKVDTKLLTPEAQGRVPDSLAFGLKQGYTPRTYRIGVPRTREDGEITAAVRLFGADGASEGEIYMSRAGDQWLVSDVQVSLAGLSVKRQPSKEKFFPSAYRWLLED
jgi:hypothetical protein